jgi:hypothetical protein
MFVLMRSSKYKHGETLHTQLLFPSCTTAKFNHVRLCRRLCVYNTCKHIGADVTITMQPVLAKGSGSSQRTKRGAYFKHPANHNNVVRGSAKHSEGMSPEKAHTTLQVTSTTSHWVSSCNPVSIFFCNGQTGSFISTKEVV